MHLGLAWLGCACFHCRLPLHQWAWPLIHSSSLWNDGIIEGYCIVPTCGITSRRPGLLYNNLIENDLD